MGKKMFRGPYGVKLGADFEDCKCAVYWKTNMGQILPLQTTSIQIADLLAREFELQIHSLGKPPLAVATAALLISGAGQPDAEPQLSLLKPQPLAPTGTQHAIRHYRLQLEILKGGEEKGRKMGKGGRVCLG
ncbi:hypothetical protein STAS_00437 [Striga asiatica]|uniref:Uncharacterized protein n=1 Tax=Striga asiatica TaxID=4170 RepID=A0A5A7NWN8_STRAF|nr:hypothetical protein STAS_00437 [Striga asiatica]